jgi:hypothetical protein
MLGCNSHRGVCRSDLGVPTLILHDPVNSDLILAASHLLVHPTDYPQTPPTVTRIQSLPFLELRWETLNTSVDGSNGSTLECCRLYGTPEADWTIRTLSSKLRYAFCGNYFPNTAPHQAHESIVRGRCTDRLRYFALDSVKHLSCNRAVSGTHYLSADEARS